MTVVKFGVNQSSSYDASSSIRFMEFTNMIKTRLRNSLDMFRKRQIRITDDAKITSRVNRADGSVSRKTDFRKLKLSNLIEKSKKKKPSFGRI